MLGTGAKCERKLSSEERMPEMRLRKI